MVSSVHPQASESFSNFNDLTRGLLRRGITIAQHQELKDVFDRSLRTPFGAQAVHDQALKEKLQVYELVVKALSPYASTADFVSCGHTFAKTMAGHGSKDHDLHSLNSLLVQKCGSWFIPAFVRADAI